MLTERAELMTTGYLSREEFDVLQQADYQRLTGSVGSLGAAECYFPVPYRALGGSGALSTYDKGNVWIYPDLYGQAVI
ncbi:MAG: hypothetical protein V3T19_09940 [Acidiferrobacterales bacterium]